MEVLYEIELSRCGLENIFQRTDDSGGFGVKVAGAIFVFTGFRYFFSFTLSGRYNES